MLALHRKLWNNPAMTAQRLFIALFLILAACTDVQRIADAAARDRAKVVVNGVVAQNLPGVNAAPVTDCIIEAASAQEILQIAADSVTGVKPDTVDLVLAIAQRPQSVRCIASAAITGA